MKTVLIITAVALGLVFAPSANAATAAKMGAICQKGTKLMKKSPSPNSNWSADKPCCDAGAGTGGLTTQCYAKISAIPSKKQ